MEPITISFTLTEEDYIRSYRQFAYRKVNYYVAMMRIYFVVALVLTTFFILIKRVYFQKLSDWLPILMAIISFIAFLYFERIQMRQRIRSDRQLTQPGSLEFSERGVTVKNALTETLYAWQYFHEIYETTEFFYLGLAQNPKAYLFLPKRLFASPEQLDHLRELCKQQLSPRKDLE